MLIHHAATSRGNRTLLSQAVYRRAGIPRHGDVPKHIHTKEVLDS